MNAEWGVRAFLVLAGLGVFYRFGPAAVSAIRRRLAARVPSRRLSVVEVGDVVQVGLAGAAQLGVALVLLAVAGASWSSLVPPVSVWLLAGGVLLGLGELAASAFLAHVLANCVSLVRRERGGLDVPSLAARSRGGWMRSFLNMFAVTSRPMAVALAAVYVGGEELVFRVLLSEVLGPLGPVFVVVGSTVAFMAVQTLGMPSWRHSLFPVAAALVMGVTHGILFLMVPHAYPLIVAHLVFFLAAVL